MSDQKIGRAVLEIAIDDKQYKFALSQVEKDSEKTAKATKSIWDKEFDGAAFVKFGAIAVGAVAAVGAAIVKLGQRGANVADVASSFGVLSQKAGETADVMLGALREGVVGTMSDIELMKAANSALGAGLVKSADDMKTLSTGARALAKATGGETSAAFDTLTSAIASGRTAQLKQLGIFVDSKVAIQNYATALGKSTGDLTDAERAAALGAATVAALRDRLKEIPPDAADFGEMIEVASARLENFVDQLSVAVSTSPVLQAGMKAMGAAIDGAFGVNQQETIKSTMGFINGFAIFVVNAGKVAVEVARFIGNAWVGLNVLFNNVMAEIAKGVSFGAHKLLELAQAADLLPDSMVPGLQQVLPGLRDLVNMVDGAKQSFVDSGAAAVNSGDQMNMKFAAVQGVLTDMRTAMVAAGTATVQTAASTGAAFDAMGEKTTSGAARTVESAKKIADTFRQLEADIAINTKVGMDKRLAELDAGRAKEIAGLATLKEMTRAEYDQLVALITEKYAQLTAAARLGGDEIRDRHTQLQQEIALAETTGTQQRLMQIDFARAKEIEGLAYLRQNYGTQYEALVVLVNEKYAQMSAAATGHGLTVQQAAAAAGFSTRAELENTANLAIQTYERMKASGLFTTNQLKEAHAKAEEAKREAKGTTAAYTLTSDAAVMQGSLQLLNVLGEKNKMAAIAGAIINTYLSVTKALASAPWPGNLVLAAGALAAGMAQVSKIRSAKSGGYKEGTPGLDFANFGAVSFQALHGREAVIPQGKGHVLAGEIASAMPGGMDSAAVERLDRIAESLAALPQTLKRAFVTAMQAA